MAIMLSAAMLTTSVFAVTVLMIVVVAVNIGVIFEHTQKECFYCKVRFTADTAAEAVIAACNY